MSVCFLTVASLFSACSLHAAAGAYSIQFPGQAALQAAIAGNSQFAALNQFRLEARYEAIPFSTNRLMYIWTAGSFVSSIYGTPNGQTINVQDYSAGAPVTCSAAIGNNTSITVRMQKDTAGAIAMQIWDASGAQLTAFCESAPARSKPDDLSAGAFVIGASSNNIGAAGSTAYAGAIAFLRLFSSIAPNQNAPTEQSGPGDLLDLEFEQSMAESHGIAVSPLPQNAAFAYVPSLASAAPPAFNPPEGVYSTTESVTIGAAAPNLRYTTDNTDPASSPTASTVEGSATIAVNSTLTIRAYSFGPGLTPSAPVSATYTIDLPPPAPLPAFTPSAGIYAGAQAITISAPGAALKYTIDGSDPATSSSARTANATASVWLNSTETVKAFSYGQGYASSPTVSATYSIYTLAPAPQGALAAIVGPVTPFPTSPWPWYDLAAKGNADDVPAAALAYTPSVGAPAAGTFTLADGCNITLSGPGAGEFNAGDLAIVGWNTIDGPGTGRLLFLVKSRNGDTLTSANQCALLNIPPATGLTVYHCDAGCSAYTKTYNCNIWAVCNLNGDSWGFYDPALALYRMYLRTNDAKYLTSFRAFTDTWWTWAIDHGGKVINPPRGFSLTSQYVRALDGHPERLPALYKQLKLSFDNQLLTEIDGQDNREPGYSLLFAAVGARADSDPARHAWYCSTVASHVQLWLNAQRPDGYWSEKNNFYAYDVPGVSPWRLFAVLQALARSYDVLNDTSAAGCNNTALAARDLVGIEAAVNFAWQYGYDPQARGVFYDVQHRNDGEDGTNNGARSGTVSVSLNSTAVTGVNTAFRKIFACDGSDYIGIMDSRGFTWAHAVASCGDDTHLTLATSWGSQCVTTGSIAGGVGSYCAIDAVAATYYQTPPAFTSCRNLATSCWPSAGDRNSNRDLIWIHGWLYNVTGNPLYRTRGDELFSASYGGPAAGPGANFPNAAGACGGPGCDGIETDYMAAIHGCASDATLPCNPSTNYSWGNAYVFTSKRWGQGSGIGGADNYLAWRMLAPKTAGRLPLRSHSESANQQTGR